MNVLSLFDGMSCGQMALERSRIKVDNYFASELDKHAIKVTMKNYPNTIQLGDVNNIDLTKLPRIDLLIGGSPCQGFSFAGKQLNFNDKRSKLFFKYVEILDKLKKLNPDILFLLENVKMKKEYSDVITDQLGVNYIEINSSLVSAQRRKRLYWSNIPITQPKDRGILLKDILEQDVQLALGCAQRGRNIVDGKRNDYLGAPTEQRIEVSKEEKSNCLTTVAKDSMVLIVKEATKKGFIEIEEGECFDATFPNSKTRRGRMMKDKSNCLTAANFDFRVFRDKSKCVRAGGRGSVDRHEWDSADNTHTRKFTVIECERLQTVPDNYTAGVADTHRFKMLGNGWTVDVISEIFNNIKQ